MSDQAPAIQLDDLHFAYGDHVALDGVSLEIARHEIFIFLGPNGGGKTTLFRLLSTLLPVQRGRIALLGFTLPTEVAEVRRRLGVVFQAPSLDKKLTVEENLDYQAALYGLHGKLLEDRKGRLLEQLKLADRRKQRVEQLSGGLRRRVELAKGMLHQPQLLLLDEPSTGLDPGARADLWQYLLFLRDELGVTIVLTTHLLEEAERADRIAILDRGRIVAVGAPEELKATVGGDTLTIETDQPEAVIEALRRELHLEPQRFDHSVRLELPEAHQWVPRIVEVAGESLKSIQVGKPTLEDVFIDKTGHRFMELEAEASS